MKIHNEPTWYDGIKRENEIITREKHVDDLSDCWGFCNIEIGIVARVIVGIFTLGLSEAVFKCMRMYKAKQSEIYGPRIVKGASWYSGNDKNKKRNWDGEQSESQKENARMHHRNRKRRNRQLGNRAPSQYGLMYRNGMPTRYWV